MTVLPPYRLYTSRVLIPRPQDPPTPICPALVPYLKLVQLYVRHQNPLAF
jgi:hypothetical protein